MTAYRATCEACATPKPKRKRKPWTRLRWTLTFLGLVPTIVLAYGMAWDLVSRHDSGIFVCGSIVVGLLLMMCIVMSGAVTAVGDQKWSDRPWGEDE